MDDNGYHNIYIYIYIIIIIIIIVFFFGHTGGVWGLWASIF